MGNPHPSRSKPFKIGRKHTGALGNRAKGRLASAKTKNRKKLVHNFRVYKEKVSAFWRGELDRFPRKPRQCL